MQEMQESQVQFLGQEDPLEKEMATHFRWEIPWTEGLGGLQLMGSQKVRHGSATEQQQQYFVLKRLESHWSNVIPHFTFEKFFAFFNPWI